MLAIWRDSLCAPQKKPFGAIQPLRAIKRFIWRDSHLRAIRPSIFPLFEFAGELISESPGTADSARTPGGHSSLLSSVGARSASGGKTSRALEQAHRAVVDFDTNAYIKPILDF
jgi:hypothetical protein